MFDLHRLQLLTELKRRGTLAAVAAALSYSPSTVSQQLARLEVEAGVPLLEPVGRRLRLTPQAEILVRHAEAVLDRLEQAEAEIAGSLHALAGTVCVAAFQSAMLTLMPAMLTGLRAAHPELRVELRQAEPEIALPGLAARDHDLVVAEEYPGHLHPRSAELDVQHLYDDAIRIAVPASHSSAAGPVDLAGLVDAPWVMEPRGSSARRWSTEVCRAAGFEPDVRYETDDLMVHIRLVEEGHAVALLPDLVWVGAAVRPARLAPLPDASGNRKLFTAARAGAGRHPAIAACREALRRAVEDMYTDVSAGASTDNK